MTQKSLYWPGVAPASGADAGRYTSPEFWGTLAQMARTSGVVITSPLLRTDTDWTNIGVFYGTGNRLAVSSPANNQITIATGAWMADGQPGHNDEALTAVAVTSPAANPRIDRVVVRKNYTGNTYTPTVAAALTVGPYTARITVIAGAEAGSPVAPSLVQDTARNPSGAFGTDGTWDIPLAQYEISTGGVISSLTDEREWVDAETKKQYVPAIAGYNTTGAASINLTSNNITSRIVLDDPDNCHANGKLMIPADYISDMTSTAVLMGPFPDGDVYSLNGFQAGACGESQNTHTGTVGLAAVAVTGVVINCIQELTLTNVSADDTIYLYFQRDATNVLDTVADVDFYGWIVEYLGWR